MSADGQGFLPLRHEIIVDNFAGGGGASTGIRAALGRECNIAVNHDSDAIFMHTANHAGADHYQEDVFAIDIVKATRGQPVGLAWFSPDCKHFSKAKGGKPVEKKIRGLAWVAVKWARVAAPRVIMLENVEEFKDWGPLRKDGMPCKKRKGLTFRRWVGCLRSAGYVVESKELRACDYGAPTIRKRLFVIARRDGQKIVWPKPTHGKGKGLKPFRTAAECIDWTINCPSIFERKKPLAPATQRRIATGLMRYVVNSADPFIVGIDNASNGARDAWDINDPLRSVTAENRFAVVEPFLVNTRNGERPGQEPRTRSKDEPYFTVTAKGSQGALIAPVITKFRAGSAGSPMTEPLATITANSYVKRPGGAAPLGIAAAFLAQHNTDMVGHDLRKPMSTIVGKGCTQAPVIVKLKGTAKDGQDVRDPLHTVQAGGTHYAVAAAELAEQLTQDELERGHRVYAFLVAYYTSGSGLTGASLKNPLPTVRTKDGFGLVLVKVGGKLRPIIDIGMRMLQPHELFAAQGFPKDYQITPARDGKPLTKTAQIRLCGNSVCPPVAEALVRANFAHEQQYEAAAA